MNRLILLIGLPGSGKSSLASMLTAAYPGSQVISTDAIRAELFGSESVQGPWLLVLPQVEQQMRQAVAQSVMAIYDATNAAQCHRVEAIALARSTGFTKITGIWLDTPVLMCLERNQKRSRIVPNEVIWQMHSSLLDAPPSLKDGLDRLIRHSPASTEIAIASQRKNRTQLA
ncbi:AAA family ATPase [Microcoleus sp. FACHB-SPT15]|uniref:AAA family ATPase n=1 Tax=Microcoleus sp. FACHB-SPT15 TaxID=2692830 RepID=UPI00177E6B23|nr:AAA family ATPase [Microcoleus sp. FACHB-SPT15]MBD1806725.1 AAA family ATPase [Microcoleus sp. FACHB-SPT15]